jgi:hypothetical protein
MCVALCWLRAGGPTESKPMGVNAMPEYRAYLVGPDSPITDRIEIACKDEAEAKQWAARLVDGCTIELWQGDRKVVTFPTEN